jgi:hypothetical protein
MFNLESRVTKANAPGGRDRLLATWLRAIGDRIHREGDADAVRRGWEIGRVGYFTRRYRDPRLGRPIDVPVSQARPDGLPCPREPGSGRTLRTSDDSTGGSTP